MPILQQPRATVPFYSRHTVIVCKETLHVYVIVAYSAEHDHYEYISFYQPNWHRVHRSSHTMTLPDPDFPVLGHAMDDRLFSKLIDIPIMADDVYWGTPAPEVANNSEAVVDIMTLKQSYAHVWDSEFPSASQLHTQSMPLDTIIVSKCSKQAYKVAAFDSRHPDAEYYGVIPIDSEGDPSTAEYDWWYWPHESWISLGMNSQSVLDMLSFDEDTLLYTLKEQHHHLLQDAAPSSPPESPPSSPDLSLPDFDPNSEGLPPFEEGGPDLQQIIPRSAANIPHHPAYSIPDPTGMYTSGFLPMNVPYWSCGSFKEDQCVICKAYHWKLERNKEDLNQPLNHVTYKLCCQHGRVMRKPPPPMPPLFKNMLNGDGLS